MERVQGQCDSESQKVQHHKQAHSTNNITYKCKQCQTIFRSQLHHDGHMYQNHAKSYVCHVCNKLYNKKNELMVHMKDNHTEKVIRSAEFKCFMCDHQESTEDELAHHIDVID